MSPRQVIVKESREQRSSVVLLLFFSRREKHGRVMGGVCKLVSDQLMEDRPANGRKIDLAVPHAEVSLSTYLLVSYVSSRLLFVAFVSLYIQPSYGAALRRDRFYMTLRNLRQLSWNKILL